MYVGTRVVWSSKPCLRFVEVGSLGQLIVLDRWRYAAGGTVFIRNGVPVPGAIILFCPRNFWTVTCHSIFMLDMDSSLTRNAVISTLGECVIIFQKWEQNASSHARHTLMAELISMYFSTSDRSVVYEELMFSTWTATTQTLKSHGELLKLATITRSKRAMSLLGASSGPNPVAEMDLDFLNLTSRGLLLWLQKLETNFIIFAELLHRKVCAHHSIPFSDTPITHTWINPSSTVHQMEHLIYEITLDCKNGVRDLTRQLKEHFEVSALGSSGNKLPRLARPFT